MAKKKSASIQPPALPDPSDFAIPGWLSDAERADRKRRYRRFIHGALRYFIAVHNNPAVADANRSEHAALEHWLRVESQSAVGEHVVADQVRRMESTGEATAAACAAVTTWLRGSVAGAPAPALIDAPTDTGGSGPAESKSDAVSAGGVADAVPEGDEAAAEPPVEPSVSAGTAAPEVEARPFSPQIAALARTLRDLSFVLLGQAQQRTASDALPAQSMPPERSNSALAEPDQSADAQVLDDLEQVRAVLQTLVDQGAAAEAVSHADLMRQAEQLRTLAKVLADLHPEHGELQKLAAMEPPGA